MRHRAALALLILVILPILVVAHGQVPSKGDATPHVSSDDKTYGYLESNPIKVGRLHGGPRDSELFFAALRGPNGQQLKVKRLGSCCVFETPNAFTGGKAVLDRYEISYADLKTPIILFLNIYDYEQPKVPVGFTKSK